MSFDKFNFRPAHQPDPEKPVEFELKPLSMPTFFRLQASINRDGNPSFEDCVAIFQNNVVSWSGLPQECTANAKQAMLSGEANPDLYIWLGQLAGELYTRALLKGSERKNF